MDYHATEQAYLDAKLILFERIVAADGAAVVAADNASADQVIAAAAGRGLRVLTVGRKGSGIRLIDAEIDGFSQTLAPRARGALLSGAAAAGRRLPGGERAGRGRHDDRDRQRSRGRVRMRWKASRARKAGSN